MPRITPKSARSLVAQRKKKAKRAALTTYAELARSTATAAKLSRLESGSLRHIQRHSSARGKRNQFRRDARSQ